jgi:hypothetical protein
MNAADRDRLAAIVARSRALAQRHVELTEEVAGAIHNAQTVMARSRAPRARRPHAPTPARTFPRVRRHAA